MKINSISPEKHSYLQIITTIAKVPKRLYFIGTLPDERLPSVAIVGTRKPTTYGKEVAHQLAYDLASKGIVIISGLALGIDAIAHRAALEAKGRTIAVQANGLNSIYPATNRQLAIQIIQQGGALLSEYEPDVEARAYRFLERNRIVSGLADAVIVVEAAIRSGTLATVTHALEQGREVFVVPGNITSPLSSGCNALIKQGASIATCANDIIEVIAPQLLEQQMRLTLGSTSEESIIIELLKSGVRDGDELQAKSDTDAATFATTLTMLEINGIIRALGGNQWTLK